MSERTSNKAIKSIHLAGDLVLVNLSFALSYFLKFDHLKIIDDDRYLLLLIIFNISWVVATSILKSYDIYRVTRNENVVLNLIKLFALQILLVTAFWVFWKAYYYSREHLIVTYLLSIVSITSYRLLALYILKIYRKKGYNFRHVVIVGAGEIPSELFDLITNNRHYGYKLIGVFDDNHKSENIKGTVKDVEAFCLENSVDELYCSVPDLETDQLKNLIEFADNNLIRIKILPDVRGFLHKNLKIDFFEYVPMLVFRNIALDEFQNKLLKRAFDIIFSLLVLVLICSWLFPVLALLIKSSSRGPIFFRQKRSGQNNEEFWCYKFRSMRVNKESDKKQASRNDLRITRIGSFMRRTSLDEFPQFWNVFIGNMSVVGPRPHMLRHTKEYSKIIDKYMVRHFIKPGITGLAQIKGYRGETKDSKMMKNRVRLDTMYIENWSFILDLKIIILTVVNIFKKEENAF